MPLIKWQIQPTRLIPALLPPTDNRGSGNNELTDFINVMMTSVIRQLSCISLHAEQIFTELAMEANGIAVRTSKLTTRVDQLKQYAKLLNPSNEEEVSLDQISARKPFRSAPMKGVAWSSRSAAIKATYCEAEPPPDLEKLNSYRNDGKNCLKLYTNPNFFFELWCSQIQQEVEKKRPTRKKTQKKVEQDIKVRVQRRVHQGVDKEFLPSAKPAMTQKPASVSPKPLTTPSPTSNKPFVTDRPQSRTSSTSSVGSSTRGDELPLPPLPPPPVQLRNPSRQSLSKDVISPESGSNGRPPAPPPPVDGLLRQKRQQCDSVLPPPPPTPMPTPSPSVGKERLQSVQSESFDDLPMPPAPMMPSPPAPPTHPPVMKSQPGRLSRLTTAPPTRLSVNLLDSAFDDELSTVQEEDGCGGSAVALPPPPPPLVLPPPPPPLPPSDVCHPPAPLLESGFGLRPAAGGESRPPPKQRESRGDLLKAIRQGLELRKVEEKQERKDARGAEALGGLFDVQMILDMRRRALEGDSDSDYETGNDDEWD